MHLKFHQKAVPGLLALFATIFGSGCGSGAPGIVSTPAASAVARSSLVLHTDEVLTYESSPEGTFWTDRFEFARRDYLLSATERIPQLATQQWPEPARPGERPVRFTRWQQR